MSHDGRTSPDPLLAARAQQVKLLLFDVDGVLTDGGVILGTDGFEAKRFDIQDGMGITLARKAGLRTGVLTGRTSEAVRRRCAELKVEVVIQGAGDKTPAFDAMLESEGLHEEEVAYMGDDLQDLCVLERVGLAMAPANARPQVRRAAHLVTQASGGRGAVREAIETVLDARGDLEMIVQGFHTGRRQ